MLDRKGVSAIGIGAVGSALAVVVLAGCGEPQSLGDVSGSGGENDYTTTTQGTAEGKLDLLFVVDNSISMADKQELLAAAVPQMVERLVNPHCLDDTGQPVAGQPTTGLDPCPAGSTRELAPVTDLHVGVVTSSLGGHGGEICSSALDGFDPTQNDQGQLIAPSRGLDSYQNQGFLKWDPLEQYPDAQRWTVADFSAAVGEYIRSAGESGCDYEATLESWYRFLIDPEPPAEVVRVGDVTVKQGTNETLLAQRAAFLRPDSALAIVLLSDENDCSVRDDGVSWLLGAQRIRFPQGTAVCLEDPNDACCRSCGLAEYLPPAGCVALSQDVGCLQPAYTAIEDSLNLRCWEQKRRFGLDFLHSTDRYVWALTHETVFRDSDGSDEVPNPLFEAGQRDPSMVTLVGIVGVPWQALARSQSDALPLRYKPASQLHSEGAWTALVGNPRDAIAPTDPFMIESIDPRTGSSPLTGLAPEPTDSVADASSVNGHEYTILERDDLQYACTFPLLTPSDCANATGGCNCKDGGTADGDRPVCQEPGTTNFGTIQYYAKAYPGLRHLEVMRRIGDLAVPTSICPRDSTDMVDPEFGYAPVVEAMIDRLRDTLE